MLPAIPHACGARQAVTDAHESLPGTGGHEESSPADYVHPVGTLWNLAQVKGKSRIKA